MFFSEWQLGHNLTKENIKLKSLCPKTRWWYIQRLYMPLHRRASDGKTLHACLRSTGAASQQSPHDHQHDPKSLGQRKCEACGPISKWLMRLSISLLYSFSQMVFGRDRDSFSGKASQFCLTQSFEHLWAFNSAERVGSIEQQLAPPFQLSGSWSDFHF